MANSTNSGEVEQDSSSRVEGNTEDKDEKCSESDDTKVNVPTTNSEEIFNALIIRQLSS